MACHSAARIKYLGGGNLGPDLTTAYQALGEGIVSMLVNVPFPIMKPIFDSHPLTTPEAQDLAAFLQVAASQQRENPTTRVLGLIIWRGRLVSVRKAMVDRSVREDVNR